MNTLSFPGIDLSPFALAMRDKAERITKEIDNGIYQVDKMFASGHPPSLRALRHYDLEVAAAKAMVADIERQITHGAP